MDETTPLFANIQFKEAKKKGYDSEQVDLFLRELSARVGELQEMLVEATRRAEVAETQIVEANKAKVLAETLAQKAKADADTARAEAAQAQEKAAEPVNEIEAASGILALAQRTGDAAILEAEAKAKNLLADANAQAAMVVVEVEQEVEKIRSDARAEIDAHVAERSTAVELEVEALRAKRDSLQGEADNLQLYLDEHRRLLRNEVSSLTKLLEDSERLRAPQGDGPDDPDGPGGGAPLVDDADIEADGRDDDHAYEMNDVIDLVRDETESTDEPVRTDVSEPAGRLTASMLFADFDARTGGTDDDDDEGMPISDWPVVAGYRAADPLVAEPLIAAPFLSSVSEVADGADASADDVPAVALSIVAGDDLEDHDDQAESDSVAGRHTSDPAAVERAVHVADLLEAPDPAAMRSIAAPHVAPTNPSVLERPVPIDDPAAKSVPTPIAEAEHVPVAATGTDGRSGAVPASASPPSTIDLTESKLFGSDSTDEPTQAFDVLGDDNTMSDGPRLGLVLQRSSTPDDSSPLGEPDADADAAMRAFFEQDVDGHGRDNKENKDVKDPKGGRFLRRR